MNRTCAAACRGDACGEIQQVRGQPVFIRMVVPYQKMNFTNYTGPYRIEKETCVNRTLDGALSTICVNETSFVLASSVFCGVVDAFSVVDMPGAAPFFLDGAMFAIEVLGVFSESRIFRKDYLRVPFWTIIITLDNGFLKSIRWDDDCSACSKERCVDSNCAYIPDECGPDGSSCDPKIYIGWEGTDGNGKHLLSSGQVWSKYRYYSIGSVWNVASDRLQTSYTSARGQLDNIWGQVPSWSDINKNINLPKPGLGSGGTGDNQQIA